MKRILCFMLALALSLLLLGGCHAGNTDTGSSDVSNKTEIDPSSASGSQVGGSKPQTTQSQTTQSQTTQVQTTQVQTTQAQTTQPETPTIKVLSIGNSYSTDSHAWLHKLAAQNGVNMQTVNLYIGSCDLLQHATNVANEVEKYTLERNGVSTGQPISVQGALALEQWDVITIQQKSIEAGHPSSYEPYMK